MNSLHIQVPTRHYDNQICEQGGKKMLESVLVGIDLPGITAEFGKPTTEPPKKTPELWGQRLESRGMG